MFVVVNVDDLGLSPAVRRAVEGLAELSRVSSATLLVNGPDAREAARLSGPVGVGVHLNILRGRPESPAHEIPGLLGPSGLFLGDYVALFRRYLGRAFTPADAELEWSRQVERALDLGVAPTHLDSEKHIHAWPGLFEAACRVAGKYGIGWVRRPVELVPPMRWDKGARRARILNIFALWHQLPAGGRVACPHSVFGVADQGADLLPGRLAAYMKRVRPDVLEVVCHPGSPLAEELGGGLLPVDYGPMRIAAQWELERDGLAAPGWGAAFTEAGARLVHYGQLDPATRAPRPEFRQ